MERLLSRPVVVGVDGSDAALTAVRWAAVYAGERRLPLRLVHGYALPDPTGRRRLTAARDAAVGVAPEVDPDLVLAAAPAVPLLVDQSRAARLVVLGGRAGRTALGLAGRAGCPMVVVRPAPERGPVVVGVAGTTTSEPAIAFAFAEAAARATDLVAVHVWLDALLDAPLLDYLDPPDFLPTQRRAVLALAELLAAWQEKYPDVRVRREVVRDHPSAALLRFAADARLIVLGARGREDRLGVLLGSTGHDLLHHAPCPVAVLPGG
jgi:nucleotide-binding universal stress UspA family protein